MRNFKYLLGLILIVSLLCTNGGDEITGTISETDVGVIGQIVTSDGLPVKNVNVVANLVDSLDMLVAVETVQTNDTGYYNFINLSSGRYRIEGTKDIDSMEFVALGDEFYFDSLTYFDSSLFVGVDTLQAPGAVKGVVLVEGGNHLGIDIYIPGTSYDAKSDSMGNFLISGIPQDSNYTLVFSASGYVTETVDSIIVNVEDTTMLNDTIILNYDPNQTPPPPANLSGYFDSINNLVYLNWDTVAHPNLAGFIVYRKDSVNTAVEPEVISGNSLLVNTSFVDTVKGLDSGEVIIYQYQVKSQDNKNDKSGYSWPEFVKVIGINKDSVVKDSLPLKPNLLTPVNNAKDQNTVIDLVWASSGDNISYSVYFSEDSLTIDNANPDTTNNTYHSLMSLPYNTTYYWKVKAFNSYGTVESRIFNFTTKDSLSDTNTVELPDTPNVLYPLPDSTDLDTTVTIKWTKCGESVLYYVYWSEDSLNLNSIIPDSTLDTLLEVLNLSYNTMYYYKVKATNSAGSVESEVLKFTTKRDVLDPKMILISGGNFIDQYDRSAIVTDFYLMEHEVTVEMYRAYDPLYINLKGLSEPNVPVASVAWGDAIRYANWLSNYHGLDSCYIHIEGKKKKASSLWWEHDTLFYEYDTSANGYRLPTGDEWEWAGQGGGANYDYGTDDGTIDTSKAWLMGKSSGSQGPRPVKSYAPNPLNLYDMTGNVWESVWDNGFTKPTGRKNYIVPADSANTEYPKRGDGFLESINIGATVKVNKQVGGSETGYSNYDCGFRLARKK